MHTRALPLPWRRRSLSAALVAALSALALLVPNAVGAQEDGWQSVDEVIVPAADAAEDLPNAVDIDITIYQPAGATAENPVPILLHSHGWGGSKSSGADAFGTERAAGYGVVSITQRGHGNSGGLRNVEDPEFEGQDMIAVVDYLMATQDWIATEDVTEDSPFVARGGDPVMASWGGSYGGGYQYVLALTEMQMFGETRLDAMAPDITWHDLNQALAPQDVPRSAWLLALYAVGAPYVETYISEGFAYGVATGQYPDGTVPVATDLKGEFATHGPAGYTDVNDVDGDGDSEERLHLDIPMLITQGFSDNLFIFNQAWDNFHQTLTPEAREQSILVGYNGGHALPNVLPMGYAGSGNLCGGTSAGDRMDFFTAAFAGEDTRVLGEGEPYHYTTASSECLRLTDADLHDRTLIPEELDPTGTLGPATGTVTMAGAPISLALAEGPLTIAGIPELSADVYGLGYDQRVFFTLSVGTSPATAQTIQNNVMPYRHTGPVPALGEAIDLRLPGVAETVEEGETLYLTISPLSDMFFAHGSRTPGAVGFTDVEVTVPTVS